jgi:alkylhydroperoxidase/carboxymuconolactone decarboxylase family protein YurZ
MLLCMELSTVELRFLLGEIRRVLKPGGIALYSVRNTFDKHFGTGTHKSEEMYDIGGFVVHFFSEEKVRDLAAGYELLDLRRMGEGCLPRELFGVVLRKREEAADASYIQEEEGDVADHMGKFQDFFHAVFNTGVLDKKTKHLVALGASLAVACDS